MNNIKNKLFTKQELEDFIFRISDQKIIINNVFNFYTAFMHSSFKHYSPLCEIEDRYCVISPINVPLNSDYEVLEFRGDRVLDLITADYLCDMFPKDSKEYMNEYRVKKLSYEGYMTPLKSRIVDKDNLSNIGMKIFKDLLLMGPHEERIRYRENPKPYEDIFESFLGVLYLDQNRNLEICRKFVLNVFNKYIDTKEIANKNKNFKGSLLKYFHIKKWGNPTYYCIYETGDTFNKEFVSILLLDKEHTCEKFEIEHNKNVNEIKRRIKVIGENINKYKEQLEAIAEGREGRENKESEELINEKSTLISQQVINKNGSKTDIQKFTDVDEILENIFKVFIQDNIILSIGCDTKKQESEQDASKKCMLLLNLPLGY